MSLAPVVEAINDGEVDANDIDGNEVDKIETDIAVVVVGGIREVVALESVVDNIVIVEAEIVEDDVKLDDADVVVSVAVGDPVEVISVNGINVDDIVACKGEGDGVMVNNMIVD